MLNQILLVLAALAFLVTAGAAAFATYFKTIDSSIKTTAEVDLINAQANHVEAQAAAEDLLRENTIKAYEQQGASKFKVELARLNGDIREVEKKIGSKLKGFTPEEHEKELAVARKRILDLEDSIEALRGNEKPLEYLSSAGGDAPKEITADTSKGERAAIG